MLPKINRLKKRRDFERVFKKGRSAKEDFLILKTSPNGLEISRFGFVAGLKVSKKATVRNKIKRQLSEVIKNNLAQIKKGMDVVMIVLKNIEAKKFKEIKTNTEKLLMRSGLLKR